MQFALTFAIGCPLKDTVVYINAQNESNARLYAKTIFGHIWAGIYYVPTYTPSPRTHVIIADTTAEEGLRRAFENNWIQVLPSSILNFEGEDE